MNNTPETDRIVRNAEMDDHPPTRLVATLIVKCAKLERERNEARDDAEHWKSEYEIVVARLCGVNHKRDNGIISEHEIIPKLELECSAWKECADRLYSSSGWHDQWPMAVQHYKQLKKKYE